MPDLEATQPLDVNTIATTHAAAELHRIAGHYNNCRISEHTETLTKRLAELEGRDITTDPLAMILDAFAEREDLDGQLNGEIDHEGQAFHALTTKTPEGFTITLTRLARK